MSHYFRESVDEINKEVEMLINKRNQIIDSFIEQSRIYPIGTKVLLKNRHSGSLKKGVVDEIRITQDDVIYSVRLILKNGRLAKILNETAGHYYSAYTIEKLADNI